MRKLAIIGVYIEQGKVQTCVFAECDREYCVHTDLKGQQYVCPHFCEVETVDYGTEVICDMDEGDANATV